MAAAVAAVTVVVVVEIVTNKSIFCILFKIIKGTICRDASCSFFFEIRRGEQIPITVSPS